MKSQIKIVQATNSTILPAAPEGAVITSSKELWQGIKVEHHILSPAEMPEHLIQEHRLMINLARPVPFEWRSGNVWSRKLFQPGNFTLLSHGETHAPRWHEKLEFIAIAICPEFTNRLIEAYEFSFKDQRIATDPLLFSQSKKLLYELRHQDIAGKVYGETLAIGLALHLIQQYARDQHLAIPRGKLSSQQLSTVVEYAHETLSEGIGLSALAAQANLSPYHFAHQFKRTIGMAPYQFLQKLRIEKAKQMMVNNKKSLTEIALSLGFTDQSHFCNAFRKATGIAPSGFKKQ